MPAGEPIRIYFDEDAMDTDLVSALRSRGLTVVTPQEVGMIGATDEEQLACATAAGCALYTFNVSDFYKLHVEWIGAGRHHAGLIFAPQQRYSVGEQLRRILRLCATLTAGQMRNQIQFLGRWG